MNLNRRTARTANQLVQVWAKNKFDESVLERMRAGYDHEQAVAETRAEFADPEAAAALEREFRDAHPDAVVVAEDSAARYANVGPALRPTSDRFLNLGDRHTAAAIAADPLGERVIDAAYDGDQDEAERRMRHVAARVAPSAFIDKATDPEIEDAMRHGGVPTPEQMAMERYAAMTPEQLDREMEREFGSAGAKSVSPGMTFNVVRK